jgi:hypothetical protein
MMANEPSAARIIIIDTPSQAVIDAVLRELGRAEGGQSIHIGDINNVTGQAVGVGSYARSADGIIVQISSPDPADVNLSELAAQLEMVRSMMKNQYGLSLTAEQDDEVGHVARALIAARKGDRERVAAHLKQVGRWTFKVAKEAGAEILALTLAHLVKGLD